MSKGLASSTRLILLATTVFVCFGAVGFKLVYLHVLNRDHLVSYVDERRRTVQKEPARRGDILDAKGDVLATSHTLVELAIDPWDLKNYLDTAEENHGAERARHLDVVERRKRLELAQIIDVPLTDLETVWQPSYREVERHKDLYDDARDGRVKNRWIKIHPGVAEKVFNALNAINVSGRDPAKEEVDREFLGMPRGVTYRRYYQRTYPGERLAAHVIGFVNKEDKAAMGVERFADFYLRGQDGWWVSERDGRRRELAHFRTREVPVINGYDVVLSIDSVVQHLIESELQMIADLYHPEKATIIVSDAKSGFLLGLANYPTYDLNKFNKSTEDEQRNTAVTDLIDPGSTFKIVPAASALNAGLVTPMTRFNCSIQSIEFQGRLRKFMPDDHPYDHPLTVAEIISQSSNIGASQIAMKLGERGLYHAARSFGFGEDTGFPFGAESRGLLNTPDKWSALEITRIPAGYSISATPMQIHYAMATIASGGELLQPQLIREIRDAADNTVFSFGGITRRRVLEPHVAREMARMLVGVTSQGTAKQAAIEGYQVAGKTGTAQKLIDGRYSRRNHVGSFVGFFPASDPQVVITVIVDDAKLPDRRVNYGSAVAVPSFHNVAQQLIPYLDIKPVAENPHPLYAVKGGLR